MNEYIGQQYVDLQQVARDNKLRYQEADPFPSISFENFFNEDALDRVLAEFPDLQEQDSIHFDNAKEKKFAGKGELSFGTETRHFMHFLNSQPFLEFLQNLTNVEETLIGDPYFYGGGLHEIKRGGLLKVHADFNKHDQTDLDRRLNVLVYLNKDWHDEYGGHFELWDKQMKECRHRIAPRFNTLAIFSTTSYSFHGHPDPLNCPKERSRRSLALYYYTNGRPESEIDPDQVAHGTLFKARSGDTKDAQAFSRSMLSTTKGLIKEFVPPIVVRAIRKIRS